MAFPSVPSVLGVPPLPRDPLAAAAIMPALLFGDSPFFFNALSRSVWGIFKGGAPALVADSVVALDHKQTYAVADYPLEKGAFESYDKVNNPFDTRVRLSCGGNEDKRRAFLDELKAIAASLDLYDVVTPDQVYSSVNIANYSYRRTAINGAGMIVADVWLVEVRVTAEAAFTSTKSPSGADPVSVGTVQPTGIGPARGTITIKPFTPS